MQIFLLDRFVSFSKFGLLINNPVGTAIGQKEGFAPNKGLSSWMSSFRVQAVIVALLALLLYGNTIKNEYAFDDSLVIVRNEFVHRGFAGLPDIFSKDAYYSYFNQLNTSNQLSGGRYRPLSLVISFLVNNEEVFSFYSRVFCMKHTVNSC